MPMPNGNGSAGHNGNGASPGQRPVELDSYVMAAGGRQPEDFPSAVYPKADDTSAGGERLPAIPGRFLLRLISVQPNRCRPRERAKFYLMAVTVVLNAAVAAYTVPTGLAVAFPGLRGIAGLGLGLLGAGVVGVMDALIVGHWVSAARYRVNPPERPPALPTWWRRLGVFIPRLGFTLIIVFGLGLMLTLSANKGVIAKQASVDAISDRNNAIKAAQALDDQIIQQDTIKLASAERDLTKAQNQETADQNRASCELYGRPRVPGCSPHAGPGFDYRHFKQVANGPDQKAVAAAQGEVNSVQAELTKARKDKAAQGRIGAVKTAAVTATGLSAVSAEWDEYASSHHLSWMDRYLMDLLVLGVDLVPIGMKLFGGMSSYEALGWEYEWNEAVTERRRRMAEHRRLATFQQFYDEAAGMWLRTRLSKLEAWLEADAANPGEPPLVAPPALVPLLPTKRFPEEQSPDRARISSALPQPAPPSPATASQDEEAPDSLARRHISALTVADVNRLYPRTPAAMAHYPAPTPADVTALRPTRSARPGGRNGDRSDPVRDGRDAVVGDIVQLAAGPYRLLAQITDHASYNGDVFIAGLVPYRGQTMTPGHEIPVRAVKFTRTDDRPRPAEFEFVNRFPAPGETLLRTLPRSTAGNLRLIYESQYFPRSDVMRYLYGSREAGTSPRITTGQVLEIMSCVSDAQRRIWEENFLHNDTRLRNLIMTGPLEDGRYNPDQLTPAELRPGAVMLCDWGSMSYLGEPFGQGADITASLLEGDPAIFRALLGMRQPADQALPPLSILSDQYGLFSCAYQLLTGGISPTAGLLVYRFGNEPYNVARLEAATDSELRGLQLPGWPDVLVTDPLPVQVFNPDIPDPLAALIDAGVRTYPAQREPALAGPDGILRARDAASVTEEAIDRVSRALTGAQRSQPLPGRHPAFLWSLDAPVGWPDEVLRYVAENWPDYGVDG
jgi:hypothetical protein